MNHNSNDNRYQDAPFNDNNDIEIRLWEYIDGISTEPAVIETLICENAAWKAKYADLLEVHQLVQRTSLEEPSLRFTKNVMDEIARLHISPAAKQYINAKIIWGIAGFFITVIVSFLIYGFSQINWSSGSGYESRGFDFTAIDYSKMVNNNFVNVFMMINVVLGLALLDRYLNSNRKRYFRQ